MVKSSTQKRLRFSLLTIIKLPPSSFHFDSSEKILCTTIRPPSSFTPPPLLPPPCCCVSILNLNTTHKSDLTKAVDTLQNAALRGFQASWRWNVWICFYGKEQRKWTTGKYSCILCDMGLCTLMFDVR